MDYVPKKDAAFVAWVKSLFTYVRTRFTAFNIPDRVFQPFVDLNTAWKAAYAKAFDPNSGEWRGVSLGTVGRGAHEGRILEQFRLCNADAPYLCVYQGQTGAKGVLPPALGEKQGGEGDMGRACECGRTVTGGHNSAFKEFML